MPRGANVVSASAELDWLDTIGAGFWSDSLLVLVSREHLALLVAVVRAAEQLRVAKVAFQMEDRYTEWQQALEAVSQAHHSLTAALEALWAAVGTEAAP